MEPSSRQKRVEGRVLHEFKHGELKSGPSGKGGAVKSRKQAIAIALSEAGASQYVSGGRNTRNLRRSEKKEAKGETFQQEREGKSRVGSSGKRESTRAMGGKDAHKPAARDRKGMTSRARRADGYTRQELYDRAQRKGVAGRSRMTKVELEAALGLKSQVT